MVAAILWFALLINLYSQSSPVPPKHNAGRTVAKAERLFFFFVSLHVLFGDQGRQDRQDRHGRQCAGLRGHGMGAKGTAPSSTCTAYFFTL